MKNKLNKLLTITGILFLLSLPLGNIIISTFCFTLFIIAIVINCYDLWLGKNIMEEVIEVTQYKCKNNLKNKKYIQALLNTTIIPMINIGIMLVILSLICMWLNII